MTANPPSGQRLTVAHILPFQGIGGVEIATLRLVEATRDDFHHVAFCLQEAPALERTFHQAGVETASYIAPEPSARHGLRYTGESRRLARQIRLSGADIVHFADVKAAYHTSLAALLAGVRRLCQVRSSNPVLEIRYRLCLLPVQSFIFVSREALQTFAVSVTESRARVIYDAVAIPPGNPADGNSATRREFGIPESVAVVGVLARVTPAKDYFTLAKAAVEVLARFPETRFLIVGDNSQVDLNRAHYEEVLLRLNQFGISSSFIFTGHRDDVQRLVSAMDVVVLPTHHEGLPLSILESMALAKPVIATAVGGIPEIISPGVNGYLHRHENAQELAAAIIDLIADPEKARRMGLAAREHVREMHSRERFAASMIQAYYDLMRRAG
jgi:glycosyltransferase involved in cell wall biosynthesis